MSNNKKDKKDEAVETQKLAKELVEQFKSRANKMFKQTDMVLEETDQIAQQAKTQAAKTRQKVEDILSE